MSGTRFAHSSQTELGYTHGPVEARWQEAWSKARAFATPPLGDAREPAYVFADCIPASDDLQLSYVRTLAIADACARFLRAQGRAVLFSLGLDAFGPQAEVAALREGISPQAWVDHARAHTHEQLEALGCSIDWERMFVSSEPEYYSGTQALFLKLLEHGLIYRRETWVVWCEACQAALARPYESDGTCERCGAGAQLARRAQWLMRMGPYLERSEERLRALAGWDEEAVELMRSAAGRIDGVELQASVFGSDNMTVFTPHTKAIARASFVAISPAHPIADRWTAEPAVAERLERLRMDGWELGSEGKGVSPIVVTDSLASVPGTPGMLPIVISPLVDARFGPTAVLGIPDVDATDRAIAKHLPPPSGTSWKTSASTSVARAAVRHRSEEVAISRARPWGAPIPVVHCARCGTVPVATGDLPVRLPTDLQITSSGANPLAERADFYECQCPACGDAARRETDTIDSRLGRMWAWLAMCMHPDGGASATTDAEQERWLPAQQVVALINDVPRLLDRRVQADVLQDLGVLAPLPNREPFARVSVHRDVHVDEPALSARWGDLVDLDSLLASAGADTIRLAALHAASPGRRLSWGDQPLGRARTFLEQLYAYAEPRLREWARASVEAAEPMTQEPRIETTDRLRRRLAHWCTVACEKVTDQLEHLELQRATHSTMRLLTRVQDFESRAAARPGGRDADDHEAVVAALLLQVRLLAPLAPHIAEELWSLAGNVTLIAEASWPTPKRPTLQSVTGR